MELNENRKVYVAEWDERPIKKSNHRKIKYTINEKGCHEVVSHIPNIRGRIHLRVDGKKTLGHRYSYEMNKGPIPKGMVIMHSCDNEICVNPEHLIMGTQADNVMDMVSKNRNHSKKKGSNGFSMAKLSEGEVINTYYFEGNRLENDKVINIKVGTSKIKGKETYYKLTNRLDIMFNEEKTIWNEKEVNNYHKKTS